MENLEIIGATYVSIHGDRCEVEEYDEYTNRFLITNYTEDEQYWEPATITLNYFNEG